jgi:hypothetical protein
MPNGPKQFSVCKKDGAWGVVLIPPNCFAFSKLFRKRNGVLSCFAQQIQGLGCAWLNGPTMRNQAKGVSMLKETSLKAKILACGVG